jgi:hypothetical protein
LTVRGRADGIQLLDEIRERVRLVDCEQSTEASSENVEVTLRQQRDRNDGFFRHASTPTYWPVNGR